MLGFCLLPLPPSPWGRGTLGNIWRYFGCHNWGKVLLESSWVEDVEQPVTLRTVPHGKDCPAPDVINAELEKPLSRLNVLVCLICLDSGSQSLRVHQCHLERDLVKAQRSWFSKSGAGPQSFPFCQVPSDVHADAAGHTWRSIALCKRRIIHRACLWRGTRKEYCLYLILFFFFFFGQFMGCICLEPFTYTHLFPSKTKLHLIVLNTENSPKE